MAKKPLAMRRGLLKLRQNVALISMETLLANIAPTGWFGSSKNNGAFWGVPADFGLKNGLQSLVDQPSPWTCANSMSLIWASSESTYSGFRSACADPARFLLLLLLPVAAGGCPPPRNGVYREGTKLIP